MKFESFNASLSLLVKTPWREVQNGFPIDHAGKHIAFQKNGKRGYYETEDEAEIKFLTGHRLFSSQPNLDGRFWECIPPVDPMEEVRKRDAEIADLKKREADLEKRLAELSAKPKEPAKPTETAKK